MAQGKDPADYWTTAISRVADNDITIRGYPLDELTGRISYSDSIVLCLRGELPDEVESYCVNAILTAGIDHHFINSTALAARIVVSGNPDPVAGMAAGILTFGRVTGGAPSMVIEIIDELRRVAGKSRPRAAAEALVDRYRRTGRRIAGFGHPVHSMVDEHYTWRAKTLRDRVSDAGLSTAGAFAVYETLHEVFLERMGRPIPINVDGVMGASLSELGWSPLQAQALSPFTLMAGIAAHVVEEIEDGEPLRVVREAGYHGAERRHRSQEGATHG